MNRSALLALCLFGCKEAPPPVAMAPAEIDASIAPVVAPADAATAAPVCASDQDCVGFLDCCGAESECGTRADEKARQDLCNCCVSCAAPPHPGKILPCACRAGQCVKK